jgi:D-alanyl-D-alanine carboxypeptidase
MTATGIAALLLLFCASITGATSPEAHGSDASSISSPNRKSAIENLKSIDSSLAKKLQSEIERQIEIHGLQGISAAVIVPGSGKWIGVAGISSDIDPMRPEMILGAGSITKTFTATLILQLAEEGKLTLDDSLHEWLPAYPNIDSTVTIRQLLNHTSGIYNYTNNPEWNDSLVVDLTRYWEPEEVVSKFVKARAFQAGIGWQYSNTGYILLGMIAEKAAKSQIAIEFRRRYFTPLGMAYTHLEADEESTHEMAHPWSELDGDGAPDDVFMVPRPAIYSTAWTAGAIFSTADDLTEWGRALYGGHVLKDASLQQMLTFRNLSLSTGMSGYGLGAARIPLSRGVAFGHGGNIFGYSAILLFNPSDSVVVAALVNGPADGAAIGIALMETVMSQASGVDGERIAGGNLSIENIRRISGGTFAIDYHLSEPGNAAITIYNILGSEIATIVRDRKSAGRHTALFDGSHLPQGPYFCRLQVDGKVVTRKIGL